MKEFYTNIGDKLQMLAKVCGVIGLVGAAIGVLLMLLSGFDDEAIAAGLVCIVSGIASLVSSWPLYAFGQLVNDVHSMRAGANAENRYDDYELPEI